MILLRASWKTLRMVALIALMIVCFLPALLVWAEDDEDCFYERMSPFKAWPLMAWESITTPFVLIGWGLAEIYYAANRQYSSRFTK